MLPGEREDLQAVVVSVTDVELVPDHSQLLRIVQQPSPETVAKLQRLRVQGDDLIPGGFAVQVYHAKEKPDGGGEHWINEVVALELELGDERPPR